MDEPCSALDPIATQRIEDLMRELVADYTIVIVTHNMQQAARVSDRTAFFTVEVDDAGDRTGVVVEVDRTETIFTEPERPADRGLRHRAVRMSARPRFHDALERIERELLGHRRAWRRRAVRDAVDALVRNDDAGLASGSSPVTTRSTTCTSISSRGSSRLLALQAPVAADLRLVSVLMHSGLHLERIGDQAVNVAKIHLVTRELPSSATILQQLGEMGVIVVGMVQHGDGRLPTARPRPVPRAPRAATIPSTG